MSIRVTYDHVSSFGDCSSCLRSGPMFTIKVGAEMAGSITWHVIRLCPSCRRELLKKLQFKGKRQ